MPNFSQFDFAIILKWFLCFFTINMESTKIDWTCNKSYCRNKKSFKIFNLFFHLWTDVSLKSYRYKICKVKLYIYVCVYIYINMVTFHSWNGKKPYNTIHAKYIHAKIITCFPHKKINFKSHKNVKVNWDISFYVLYFIKRI